MRSEEKAEKRGMKPRRTLKHRPYKPHEERVSVQAV